MYDSPKHNITTDSLGNMVRKYDVSSKRTTLIDNNVRVYKGGSWGDRLFWLSPGARRYKDEDKSDRTIGFRCAMGRVGGAAGNEDVGGNMFKEGGKTIKRRYK